MDQFDLCVYCRRRPVEARFRPFCSERCRLLDLASWAEGSYRIPGEAVDAGESAATDDESEPASQGS